MATYARRKPDPDRILGAKLNGRGLYLARAGGPLADAVAQLRELANGRADLLAEEAGLMLAAYSVRIETGDRAIAAGLLIMAGADVNAIARWVEIGRRRMTPTGNL
jgi:hypothetical protein